MSFKEYASANSLVNRALGMISESKTVSDLDNDSGIVAQAARRWYKPVVARLLEMHHWGLATKRSPLVSPAVNDRGNEWLYALVPPVDMAFPVGFVLGTGASSFSYYRGLAGLIGMINGRQAFQYHNGRLYTNYSGDLEYVSYEITEADFNATFEDIVVHMLASRLALELPKDKGLSDELAASAQQAINVAITQNLNSGNPRYGNLVSEAELARGSLSGHNWDYFPLSPGF